MAGRIREMTYAAGAAIGMDRSVVIDATTRLLSKGLNNPPLWKASLHHCKVKFVTTSAGLSPKMAAPGAKDTMKIRYNGNRTSSTDPSTQNGKVTLSGT